MKRDLHKRYVFQMQKAVYETRPIYMKRNVFILKETYTRDQSSSSEEIFCVGLFHTNRSLFIQINLEKRPIYMKRDTATHTATHSAAEHNTLCNTLQHTATHTATHSAAPKTGGSQSRATC